MNIFKKLIPLQLWVVLLIMNLETFLHLLIVIIKIKFLFELKKHQINDQLKIFKDNSTQEYNIFLDPEATNIVFKTFGTKVILVPLKAINYVPITRQWFDQFQKLSGTAEIEWTQKFYRELKDLWHEDENIFFQEAYVWDAVASIVITNPEVILDIKVDLVYVQESSDPNFHDPILIEPDVGKVIVNPENGQGYPINIIRKLDGLKINDILMHKLSQKYFETSRCPDNQPSNFLQF